MATPPWAKEMVYPHRSAVSHSPEFAIRHNKSATDNGTTSPSMTFSSSITSWASRVRQSASANSTEAAFVTSKVASEVSKSRSIMTREERLPDKLDVTPSFAMNSTSMLAERPLEIKCNILNHLIAQTANPESLIINILQNNTSVLFPAAYDHWQRQEHPVDVFPDGIQYKSQARIQDLEFIDQDKTKLDSFFSIDQNPFRVAYIRNIVVNIHPPAHFDEAAGQSAFARMFQNLVCLVDRLAMILTECPKNKLLSLKIIFRDVHSDICYPPDHSPSQNAAAPIPSTPVRHDEKLDDAHRHDDMFEDLVITDNNDSFWSCHDRCRGRNYPRPCNIPRVAELFDLGHISYIELVLFTFARLRNVGKVQVTLPHQLRTKQPALEAALELFQQDIMGCKEVSSQAVGIEGAVRDRMVQMLYGRSIQCSSHSVNPSLQNCDYVSDFDMDENYDEEQIMAQFDDDDEQQDSEP